MTVTCKYDDGTIEAHFVAETEAVDTASEEILDLIPTNQEEKSND